MVNWIVDNPKLRLEKSGPKCPGPKRLGPKRPGPKCLQKWAEMVNDRNGIGPKRPESLGNILNEFNVIFVITK